MFSVRSHYYSSVELLEQSFRIQPAASIISTGSATVVFARIGLLDVAVRNKTLAAPYRQPVFRTSPVPPTIVSEPTCG